MTLELTDEQAQKWAEEAHRLNLTSQQLVTQSVEKRLSGEEDASAPSFEEAMDYVFQKNAELYRRLA